MKMKEVIEALRRWVVAYKVKTCPPGVEVEGLELVFGWDDESGALTLFDVFEGRERVVIRTRSRLEHVCLCLALAQARAGSMVSRGAQ